MSYTDSAAVAAYLGLTLTSAQENQAGVLADAATAWIDRFTGRSWQQTSPVTDELHRVDGNRVYLDRRPVVAVTSVKSRLPIVSSDYVTLGASEYRLDDAANGVMLIQGWGNYQVAVSYTHTMTSAPADVQLAACMIAASWLSQALRPSTNGLESVSVGQGDVAVKFSASRSDVPREALSILSGYRTVVIA